jgi:hypothetical protein
MDDSLWSLMVTTHAVVFAVGWVLGCRDTFRITRSYTRDALDDLSDATEQDEGSEWQAFFREHGNA